ncbi:MAG: type VI secretion system amidase immunity protein Tai4 [Azoarcus sp.]|jgi:phage/plasmid-associated DNA primase|nr:type VI secretion system amidase immunity protein Tai4 [Azoarcus sp.]
MKQAIWAGILTASALAFWTPVCHAAGDQRTSPQAGARTHVQNYKDMVLATCIANTYKNDKGAAIDAGRSASALRDWTEYDLEKAPDAINTLVDGYLARNYHNPLVESEIKDVRFDFLKCLDLYHSEELDAQVKRLVIHPKHIHRGTVNQQKTPP